MRSRILLPAVVSGLLLAGCTSGAKPADPAAPGATGTTTASTPAAAPTAPTGTDPAQPTVASPTTSEAPVNPVSIQALIDADYDGHGLKLGREGGSTAAYREYFVTYEGSGLTISGRIAIPRGKGPFPAVVNAHGYVPPDQYTNGETMLRERDYLARRGYVVLHVDYRNHAQSDDDPDNEADLRLGYTADVINAALALQQDSRVDPKRIALIGRSMGGGVLYNALVVRPGLFRAAVAYSPVSSDAVDNFDKWVRPDGAVAKRVLAQLGSPEDHPQAWADVSPRTFFARITEPVLIHHGTADEECPIAWSEATVAALTKAGKHVEYHVYRGQRHTFTSQWPLSIQRTVGFLEREMG